MTKVSARILVNRLMFPQTGADCRQRGLSGGEVLETGDVLVSDRDDLEPLPVPGGLPKADDGVIADGVEVDQLDVGVDALERTHQIDDLVCARTIDGWV